MKRLLLAVAALCAFAAFAVTSAGAGTSLELGVSAAPTSGAPVTFTVTGAVDEYVALWVSEGTCEDEGAVVGLGGRAPFTGSWTYSATLDAGSYAVDVYTATDELCTDVIVAEPVAVPVPAVPSDELVSSYLCWNHDMVNPVAYIDKTADTMWKTGNYIEPQAILGNVVDGTNIGAYHLVCNAPTTMQKTALALGGSGEVYTADTVAAYHADHPVNGNDLNIYHIYEVTPGGGNG